MHLVGFTIEIISKHLLHFSSGKFMDPVVLENKERQINNRRKHNFIKIISYPATCFDPLGFFFSLIFETY